MLWKTTATTTNDLLRLPHTMLLLALHVLPVGLHSQCWMQEEPKSRLLRRHHQGILFSTTRLGSNLLTLVPEQRSLLHLRL
jgi:hypothetical protein